MDDIVSTNIIYLFQLNENQFLFHYNIIQNNFDDNSFNYKITGET